jgi:hypothetical protein
VLIFDCKVFRFDHTSVFDVSNDEMFDWTVFMLDWRVFPRDEMFDWTELIFDCKVFRFDHTSVFEVWRDVMGCPVIVPDTDKFPVSDMSPMKLFPTYKVLEIHMFPKTFEFPRIFPVNELAKTFPFTYNLFPVRVSELPMATFDKM